MVATTVGVIVIDIARDSYPRKVFWSACLGNFFEHYETALFGFLAPFLASQIFPEQDPIMALTLTYAIIPLGMLARPLGALLFGYIGDVYGRRQALFLSLVGMSLVCGLIALAPTYAQAGILAPLTFSFGRLLQNIFCAGETMGGAIFLLENSPDHKRDFLSGLYDSSTIAGILLASAAVFALSYFNAVNGCWRFLYLFGGMTALIGCWIRWQLPDKYFHVPTDQNRVSLSNMMQTLWLERRTLLWIAISAGFSYSCYSMSLVLMNGFVPLVTPFTKSEMMSLNSWLLMFDFAALPMFGWLASKTSRDKLMLGAALGVIIVAIPLSNMLPSLGKFGVIVVRTSFVLLGVAFSAPFHAWAQSLVPAERRYTVVSFGYAIGSQLLGSPTAALSLWAFQQTGVPFSIAWYWMLLALGGCVAVVYAREPAPSFNAKKWT